jgi:mannose-6-phosphate isomerase
MRPYVLAPNQLHRFYKGGARIAELRSSGNTDPYAPEEWIASMASPFGEPGVGIAQLPDGNSLPDAVAGDPEGFLGPDHVARFGPDVAVLIKLLDAGERLPVHFHPDDTFARTYFESSYGKTEAWIVVDAEPGAQVQVGFAEAPDDATVADWVRRQAVDEMLAALRTVDVAPGDTIYVPAGTPHAIGAGILICELQQPTDFSILMEYEKFTNDDPNAASLGLGFDVALRALDRNAWSEQDLADARSTRRGTAGNDTLFPQKADAYFRAQRIHPAPTAMEQGFSVLLVTDGTATLTGDGWDLEMQRGAAVLVPFGAGPTELSGPGQVLRCMPPDPAAA